MKRFFCQCGQEVFFNNLYCNQCARDLVYDPSARTLWSGELRKGYQFYAHSNSGKNQYVMKICKNRFKEAACNWVVSSFDEDGSSVCLSCRTTQTEPDLKLRKNKKRVRLLEMAKRRMMAALLDLKLISPMGGDSIKGLKFDFLEDKRSNPKSEIEHVLSGHYQGLITINVAEADEGFLHVMKEQMGEKYRTLLGHFRHEIGHYFWCRLIDIPGRHDAFRQVFGDERADYGEALKKYYDMGLQNRWMSRFITPYAGSHPHEDWAETWAHYLHMVDTLETAVSYGLSVYEPKKNDFDDWFAEWGKVAQVMTALNRSLGLMDPYPFSISEVVKGKLRFIDELVESSGKLPDNFKKTAPTPTAPKPASQ
ncbi:zinc-binding metallopeptidase family protein [Thiosulfativibrio zosterae]|uniref:Zinc-ribbon domain-containing protein n=1 Tax=Thiosulfativibrio zosterae TaxID=2675053 RepID=A0A6F8PNZ4_9GAMM|nr:putative zinc-binding metallopeptidase [Thiosulfativibrio zosterae]BBP43710.1 hypothetical protein THMIRHAT_14560 [Thiosulfativibrio zosterae]